MVEPISRDPVFRSRVSLWTRTVYIASCIGDRNPPEDTISFVENHFLTMLSALGNLKSLYLIEKRHQTIHLTADLARSLCHSLTHLTIQLTMSKPDAFAAVGLLVQLRELYVECQSFDVDTRSAQEDLRVMKPWNHPHLQTLDWHQADVITRDHRNAFLGFLARQRFPALWDLGLTLKDRFDEDVCPLKTFLHRHPTISSLTVWAGAAQPDFLVQIFPHIHARRFHIGSCLDPWEVGFIFFLPSEIRELVLTVDGDQLLLYEEIFEELENEQNNLGLERVVVGFYDTDLFFEWSMLAGALENPNPYCVYILSMYMAHAFRLRKRGIALVDETDVSIFAEPIKVCSP
jgi:hypothetical protein